MGKWDESRTGRDEQRRKYSNMDKRAKDKLVRSLERMEEDRLPKKIFTQELEGTRRRRRPSKRWEEEVENDFQVLGECEDGESWCQIGKMEGHCSTG